MADEARTQVGDGTAQPEVVSSGIELDKDFVPAEVIRTAEPVTSPGQSAAMPAHQSANVATNTNVTNVATTVNVGGPNILITTRRQQVPFILRAVWFCLIGFWLSAVFILVGYLCCATLVLAPVGFWFLNRVPQAQTLRLRNTEFHATQKDGVTHLTEGHLQQVPWYYRALYFPFGLVLGLVWLTLAWLVSLPILTLPLSIWMIDRAPTVISLQRQ